MHQIYEKIMALLNCWFLQYWNSKVGRVISKLRENEKSPIYEKLWQCIKNISHFGCSNNIFVDCSILQGLCTGVKMVGST